MNLRVSLSLLAAASFLSLGGCAADTSDADAATDASEVSEEAATAASPNYGYFAVTHRDFRKCAAPMCGGYFVKRVNQATTVCADGKAANECYVAAITLGGIGLSDREEATLREAIESGRALLKARTYKTTRNGFTYGTLKANEGWVGATGSAAEGTFFRAADNGIRCIKAPCPSTTAYALNGTDQHNVIKVGLENTASPASQLDLDRASVSLGTKDGILVAGGILLPKCIPGSNCGPILTASEFYLRLLPTEGKSCGGHTIMPSYCNDGQFCNWKPADICGAADAPGRCAYKPEVCNRIFAPVCACDGKTYGNACEANAAGASVSSEGACKP